MSLPLPQRRPKRRATSGEALLTLGHTTSSLARDVADVLNCPPVRAAAALILLIFETIEGMRNNRAQCARLAERASRILLEVHDQMDGRWLDAPESLVRNLKRLEGTLKTIHEFMLAEAGASWKDRLIRKKIIESAIAEYNVLLDDAARSFQITSLIDIHCTLYEATTSPSDEEVLNQSPTQLVSSPITYGAGETPTGSRRSTAMRSGTQSSTRASTSQTLVDPEELGSVGKEEVTIPPTHTSGNVHEITNMDHEPLRVVSTLPSTTPLPPATLAWPPLKFDAALPRLHQSQVRLTARAPTAPEGLWHAGAPAVQSAALPAGTLAYMKRYDGADASTRWRTDVEMLLSTRNPDMPKVVGLSNDRTPVPFILLAEGATPDP